MLLRLAPEEMAVVAYMTLKLMWIKFLLLWRFFRLWSMADGIEAPENMKVANHCICNVLSLSGYSMLHVGG